MILFRNNIASLLYLQALDGAWLYKYSWRCEPVDFSWTPDALRVARGCYIYFITKLTELLDTVTILVGYIT